MSGTGKKQSSFSGSLPVQMVLITLLAAGV
jgi:hypothetical protein